MDIVIGIVFWGGLLWLALVWLARLGGGGPEGQRPSTGPSDGQTGATAPVPPSSLPTLSTPPAPTRPPAVTAPPADRRYGDGHRDRVDDAFVDGLVIGHFVTRDHYQPRIGELEDAVEDLGHQRDVWAGGYSDGEDDLDDGGAGLDAGGGFAADTVDDDPWADDLYDLDDDLFDMDDED